MSGGLKGSVQRWRSKGRCIRSHCVGVQYVHFSVPHPLRCIGTFTVTLAKGSADAEVALGTPADVDSLKVHAGAPFPPSKIQGHEYLCYFVCPAT